MILVLNRARRYLASDKYRLIIWKEKTIPIDGLLGSCETETGLFSGLIIYVVT